jgi:hypothetical protein
MPGKKVLACLLTTFLPFSDQLRHNYRDRTQNTVQVSTEHNTIEVNKWSLQNIKQISITLKRETAQESLNS